MIVVVEGGRWVDVGGETSIEMVPYPGSGPGAGTRRSGMRR